VGCCHWGYRLKALAGKEWPQDRIMMRGRQVCSWCCNAEWCLRAKFRKVPQVTEERGREGKRPCS